MPSTLLLADDSVTIQRVIELTFQNEDIRVIATSDGESAIQRINAEPPDIVLADVGMPKQDGYAVAAHVKRTPMLRKIPVLLLTGAFEPVDEDKARASGCDGILVKPFEPQQLVGRVKELLSAGAASSEAATRQFELASARPAAAATTPPGPAPAPVMFVPRPVPPAPAPAARPPAPIELAPRLVAPPMAAQKPVPAALPEPDNPDVEASFQREFDQLDAAFAQLDPEPAAAALDDETASDFARDLDLYRSHGDATAGADAQARDDAGFGDWDIPNLTPTAPPPPTVPAVSAPTRASGPLGLAPEAPPAPPAPPVSPARPETPPAPYAATPPTPPAPPPAQLPRVSMASAFAALLAAEQAQPSAAAIARQVQLSEATVEEVVRRVLARMTDDTVRQIVHDTAERLIKEEIERIKAQ